MSGQKLIIFVPSPFPGLLPTDQAVLQSGRAANDSHQLAFSPRCSFARANHDRPRALVLLLARARSHDACALTRHFYGLHRSFLVWVRRRFFHYY